MNLTFYTALSSAGQTNVATKLVGSAPYADVTALQVKLNDETAVEQNAEVLQSAINAVNSASSNADMQTALEDYELGLILTSYDNLTGPEKTLAAGRVLDYRTAHGAFGTKNDIQTALNNAVTDQINARYLAAVNNASDRASMKAALEDTYLGLILTSYQNLSSDGKDAVVDAMLANRGAGYADKTAIQTQLNLLVTDRTQYEAFKPYVDNVNSTADATAMRSALEAPELGLDLTLYYSFSASHKMNVAAALLAHRTANGAYARQSDIQAAFTPIIANERLVIAVEAVNTSYDTTSTHTAITSPVLGLNLTVYNALLKADRNAVADLVRAGVGGGYADKAAIQTALDSAIATNAPMAAVNKAATAAAAEAALEDVALGLNLGASYPAWTTADQAAVAADVVANRPSTGYVDAAAVQTAFDNAVTARTDVANINIAADAAATQAALEAGSLGLSLGVYSSWITADKAAVAAAVFAAKPGTGYADLASVQAAFDTAVTVRTPVANVNIAPDAAAIQAALESVSLSLNLTTYTNWTSADKQAVSTGVLTARPGTGYVDKAAVQAALDTEVGLRTEVSNINIASDDISMRTALEALTGLTLGAYATWTDADKDDIAHIVRVNRPVSGYVDQAAIQGAFDAALTVRTPVAAVNTAADATAIQVALEDAPLGLNLGSAYPTWSNADRAAVAAEIFAARTANGYADLAAIQNAFDTAVANRIPVAAVNIAADATQMQTALEDGTLALTLGVYTTWTAADKTAVSADVLAGRPGTGYVDQAAVQTGFDTALAARTPVANVNVAATVSDMQTALEDVALALNLGMYSTWSTADKTAVAAIVMASRLPSGFVDSASIQSAFDAALTAVAPMANINAASSDALMQTALEDSGLGLTLGAAYTAFGGADRLAVANWVLNARPVGGYPDAAAVQSAFDMAVAIQNVNVAATATAMNTALTDPTLAMVLGAYSTWGAADQDAVADHVMANRGSGFADQASIQTAFNNAIAARQYIAAVNGTATDAAMQAALEDVALGLNLGSAYPAYATSDKSAVAAAVRAARGSGFADIAAVQGAFDTAVTNRSYVAAVNTAASDAAMKTALEDAGLGLNLGAYAGYATEDMKYVASAVFAGRPADGYADTAAIQTVFDNAITARSAVAAVNAAGSNSVMTTALEDPVLGLALGAYSAYSTADKDFVAATLLANRPTDGYADQPAIQTEFNSALTARTPMANVNAAGSASAMRTALEDGTLALDLTGYSGLTDADKDAIAAEVVSDRPIGGYADDTAVQAELGTAITNRGPVSAVNTAASAAAIGSAITNVSLALDLTAYNALSTADKNNVNELLFTNRPVTGFADAAGIQLALNSAISADAPMAAVNNASTGSDMKTALENVALGLTHGAYTGWTVADKNAIATDVLNGRPGTGYVDVNAIQTAFDAAVAARQYVAKVNIASAAADMRSALEDAGLGLNLGAYAGWTSTDKDYAANAVIAGIGSGYADFTAIQAAFNSALTTRTPVANVNAATTDTDMQTALEDVTLGLSLGAYSSYSTADKTAVAHAVLLAAGSFADAAAVQTALNNAVNARSAVAAVNAAADATSMQTALEDLALNLTLGTYAGYANADQDAVSSAVLAGRPGMGYADVAAIQSAFDAAVSARSAVAAVNTAADAAAMETALEAPALSLIPGAYAGWSAADQAAVASDVLSNKPTDGYVLQSDIQTAFDSAIAARTLMAAVNSSTDAASMESALEDGGLGLNLGAYAGWTASDQAAVSSQVLADRPSIGYVDLASLQNKFDEVLNARAAVAAVNTATSGTMKSALEDATLNLTLGAYPAWTSVDQGDVVSQVFTARPVDGYADTAAVQNAFNAAITARQGVANVNLANGTTMRAALEDAGLALTLGAYSGWKNADKDAAATAVLAARATTFADKTAVQTAFDNAVTARTPEADVNKAVDAAATRTALEAPGLALDLSVYNLLSNAAKDSTASYVYNGKPADGYADKAAIQTALDAGLNTGALQSAKDALEIGYTGSDKINSVTGDLMLLPTGTGGTAITWSSDNPAVVAADGTVTRPAYSTGDQAVTLTATLTLNGVTLTKEFVVKVIKNAITDEEAIANGKSVLEIGYTSGDSAFAVTNNLILPTTGVDGTTITWSSNKTGVIAISANNGIVTRPTHVEGNTAVELTATITKGAATPLQKVFVVQVFAQPETDAEAVSIAKSALQLTYGVGDSPSGVTQDITLPIAGADGTSISWTSDNTDIIEVSGANGTVKRPSHSAGNAVVTLTAEITKNGATEYKDFVLKVLKKSISDSEALTNGKEALEIGYSVGDSAASVTQLLTLPTTSADGTTVTWSSSNNEVVKSDGTVIRPLFTTGDTRVTLTATVTKNGISSDKVFTVNVLKQTALSDAEAVSGAKARLEIGYVAGETRYDVTKNITLPTDGGDGTAVTWVSSDPALIATNGVVNRPANSAGNKDVTLTATITKGTVHEDKIFTVTVIKKDISPAPAGSDITVINNASGQADTVEVVNLNPGDVVKVYRDAVNPSALIGNQTVLPGAAKATVTIAQLGAESGTILVTVTHSGLDESAPTSKAFAAESGKPYEIKDAKLETTGGIKATVTVSAKPGVSDTKTKYVVFQLMNGTTPDSIVVFEYKGDTAQTVSALFNKAYVSTHKVKVLILDSFNNLDSTVGTQLADEVELTKLPN
ncbi:immunoglobulin-like domain-containing protein [Paenibacillus chartarius]|uniref:Immunoglobulin-like domain-containing protein n=1 Tax=Paenibacillus chartarius TaxID=747481 RepID=A0ABV6DJ75_9BACL